MNNYVIDFDIINHHQITVRAPSKEAAIAWFDSDDGQEDACIFGVERDSSGPQLVDIEVNNRYSPDVTLDEDGAAQEEP